MDLNSGSRKEECVPSQEVYDKAAGEDRQPGKCLHTGELIIHLELTCATAVRISIC